MRKFFRAVWRIITAPFRAIARFFKRLFKPVANFFREEPEDTPLADVLETSFTNPNEILGHLNALRKHLFRAVAAFLVTSIVSFIFVTDIMAWLTIPVGGIEALQAIDVTEPISVVMRVALLTGFTVALPYIVLEFLLFAAPGISRRARIIGLLSIPLVFAFFIGGMLFAYYFMLDAALPVLLNFMGIQTIPRPSSYIKFVTGLMFWMGVSFEFPLISYVLAAMRILKPAALRNNWRIAVVAIAILAAMITPTVDPINMGIVMLPLIALYILGMMMSSLAWRRKDQPE